MSVMIISGREYKAERKHLGKKKRQHTTPNAEREKSGANKHLATSATRKSNNPSSQFQLLNHPETAPLHNIKKHAKRLPTRIYHSTPTLSSGPMLPLKSLPAIPDPQIVDPHTERTKTKIRTIRNYA